MSNQALRFKVKQLNRMEIEMLFAKGQYIVMELEVLYMLRMYITPKKIYYGNL
ncbi:unnamed protein product [Candidula unifasciata]|uniref:Uncharacterized protein n=1 Tax=Candidula unifasciata TaxID=100452 RepID=A0A8S3YNZ3_9EUPU|nr:unnamed protein product [Candidula unifasciata]